jgi:hypothetical protein
MIDEEKFFAWLDGELPPDEAERMEAEVAADPEMARLAQEHRAMTAGLLGAFGTVAAQPAPEKLRQAVQSAGDEKVVDLAQARAAREVRRARPLWVQMGAIAATLAVGVFAGNLMTAGIVGGGGGSSSPIEAEAGRLVASADLEGALYSRLASIPVDSGPRIGLTFRDKTGAICRTFEDHGASGIACRDSGDWRIRSLFQAPEGQSGDYRMASGADPQLMESVDSAISGEPFDAAEEKAAMERGWR